MSDPAVEAAQRAFAAIEDDDLSYAPERAMDMIAAAREALAPIRTLHKPSDHECSCCRHCVECGSIGTEWPCATARLVYTTEELGDTDE